MSLSEKEVSEEAHRKKGAEKELRKRIIRFLQECLLCGEPYCTMKEIENDFKRAGFWIEETVFLSEEKWLDTFLREKFSIKIVHYKDEKYYKYKYYWWAKACSMFRK
ncbi:hypothetical protein KAI56_02590 [Candidatus Parcubacteria bacterium]|nr:hypothetical protein [Candidatus Parcubacteria bacterium]